MRAMLKIISACLMVCASLLVWAEGGAGAGGSKTAKAPSVKLPGPAFVALETITPEHIRWHVRYLSHDLLEGRGTGQRGGDIAAEYMATQFAEYGLKPAGDHGTYMQKVPLAGIGRSVCRRCRWWGSRRWRRLSFLWCRSRARP